MKPVISPLYRVFWDGERFAHSFSPSFSRQSSLPRSPALAPPDPRGIRPSAPVAQDPPGALPSFCTTPLFDGHGSPPDTRPAFAPPASPGHDESRPCSVSSELGHL